MVLATLCYLQKNGKTLMICSYNKKDEAYNGKWNGLGGKIISGETPEECVTREVFEESGYKLSSVVLCGYLTFPKISNGEDWFCFVYKSSDFTGRKKESDEGKLMWIEDEMILSKNVWEGDKYFLPYVFRGEFFSGKFFYDNGKLLSHSISSVKTTHP